MLRKEMTMAFLIFRSVIMLATFILALNLEAARGERLVLLIAVFSLFLLWIHAREVFRDFMDRILPYTFAADVVLLAALDGSSKYVVNYYFNIYYFFVLIAAGYMLKHKQRLAVSFCIIAVAFIKYYRLIEAKSVYNLPFVISYIFFTLMVFITVSVFFNYSRILSEEKTKLNELNEELQNANRLLEEKNERIKELTIFEERNRIAREIHDSVGHNLTGLIMNLDFCEKLAEAEPSKVKDQLNKSREIAKESLTEIRRSVKALKPATLEQLPLVKSLEALAAGAREKFGADVRLNIEGRIYYTSPEFNIVIYRAVQEAITNSVKHGSAREIGISLTYGPLAVSLLIKDNGIGTKNFAMGSGLTGMAERVRELKGSIDFFTNDGFMINISIPSGGEGLE